MKNLLSLRLFMVVLTLQAAVSKQNCSSDWENIVQKMKVIPDDIKEFKTLQSSKLPFGAKGIIINNIDLAKYERWAGGTPYHFYSAMQLYISLVSNGYFPYTDPFIENLRTDLIEYMRTLSDKDCVPSRSGKCQDMFNLFKERFDANSITYSAFQDLNALCDYGCILLSWFKNENKIADGDGHSRAKLLRRKEVEQTEVEQQELSENE